VYWYRKIPEFVLKVYWYVEKKKSFLILVKVYWFEKDIPVLTTMICKKYTGREEIFPLLGSSTFTSKSTQ
jgi:hypothetical protein